MATTEELAARYGFAAAFFNADPELKRLIDDARRGNWSAEKFQYRFMNTNWYRARQASWRQWVDLATRDPAEAENKITERMAEFKDQLSQYGVKISKGQLRQYAWESLQWSWSAAQTKDILSSLVNYGEDLSGTPAALEMQIKSLANDYGVTLNKGAVTKFISGLLNEKYTEDNLRDYLKDMAKSKYAGMTKYLDMGMTVKQVAAPYVSSYAEIFEVSPDAIDMRDNLLQKALQGTPAAADKPPQMQSVYQFERALRRDPRWLRTKNAREQMTTATMDILKDWGLVA